jgi:hypothetical protein
VHRHEAFPIGVAFLKEQSFFQDPVALDVFWGVVFFSRVYISKIMVLLFCGSLQAMNAQVDLHPFTNGSAADSVLSLELAVPTTLLQILLNNLFF